jgi:hypothetical protein
LRFALDICNGGIFNEKMDIWRDELLADRGPHPRYLLRERDHPAGSLEQLVRVLREAVATGNIRDIWVGSQADRDESYRKRDNQRAMYRAIRSDITQAVKEKRVVGSRDVSFESSRASEFTLVGRHLMRLVDEQDHAMLATRWERDPRRYPFYSAFVDGQVYALHYAAIEQGKRIDDNAQADFEQLAYLTWADLFVSNDTRFLRDCFDTIWRPRGKRLETAESFVEFLRSVI